jgi:hypothetical protein
LRATRLKLVDDAVKTSLKRLGVDHIDLYQVHGFDPATPMEETLRALDDLVRQGHLRYVGVSNWLAWQIGARNSQRKRAWYLVPHAGGDTAADAASGKAPRTLGSRHRVHQEDKTKASWGISK